MNTLAGNLLGVEIAHEYLHNQGRNHRGDAGEAAMTAGAILNPVLNLSSNIINQVECGSLHAGASYTMADDGPMVDLPPTIICPADAAVECTSSAGALNTNAQIMSFLGGATATDGTCEPAPAITNNAPSAFPKRNTPVTFTATDSDFLPTTATCQANLRVVDTTPPAITCPASITVDCSQAGGTPASNATIAAFLAGVSATDVCDPAVTISNNAPAVFPLGTTPVTFSAKDADGNIGQCTANVDVVGNLTALSPAHVFVGLSNSDDVGLYFDLLAEVLVDGKVVGSGEVDKVWGGSSGFNNAVHSTISLNLPNPPAAFCPGSELSLKVSVRQACTAPRERYCIHTDECKARLWYNDRQANDHFDATIKQVNSGNSTDYFLLTNSALGTAAGPGPKLIRDVGAGKRCSPFKPFGTWSIKP